MENCYFDIPVYISVWNYITVAGHQIHLKSNAQGALAEEMNSNKSTCKNKQHEKDTMFSFLDLHVHIQNII